MRWLVQIVAGLPPAVDGVGDYALAIARALREQHGIESLFVVANPTWQFSGDDVSRDAIEGFPVIRVASKRPAALCLSLRKILFGARADPHTPVLFHCSLYGYATRALAFWLERGLAAWKRETPESPLITMFHELVADGPVWSTAYWLQGLQCGLIRRFARASAASLTSNTRYRRHLAEIAGIEESRIFKMAVLSTLGEPPGELPPVAARKRQLVVFGKPHSRDLAFSRHLPALAAACRNLKIERVLEIGPDPRVRVHGLPAAVEPTGTLPAGEASSILCDSRFGFIASDANLLSKSSVFAAYCAHGTVPVVSAAGWGMEDADGLSANRHYVSAAAGAALSGDQLEAVSQAALAWYRGHGIAAQASQYSGILNQISGAQRALPRTFIAAGSR
jgi:hypothetical protein